MTLEKHHKHWIVERIYDKLLKSNRSRTISFENFKQANHEVEIRDFNVLFRKLADRNYAHQKPRTNTWILVEDDPLEYTECIDVDQKYVENLEKIHNRRKPEAKGVAKKEGGYAEKYS